MANSSKAIHGGRRSGSGRPRKEGWSERSVYLRLETWQTLRQVINERKAKGEKGVSASSLIDQVISRWLSDLARGR